MLNNSYTQEQMIAEVNELLEFIYRKTRQEEPNSFDRLLYQLGSEYLRLISQKKRRLLQNKFPVKPPYWH